MTSDTGPPARGRIAGVAQTALPPERVLQQLRNADVLSHCIPGARSVAPGAHGRFAVRIEGSVGPFEADVTGTLAVESDGDGLGCRLHATGRGGETSDGEIDLRITLEPDGAGHRVVYDGTIVLTGAAAAMGDRIVETFANMLARLFFERVLEPVRLEDDPPAADAPPAQRLGLNPQVWVPGLCIALLVLVLVFRL